jgi:hypothetical protein
MTQGVIAAGRITNLPTNQKSFKLLYISKGRSGKGPREALLFVWREFGCVNDALLVGETVFVSYTNVGYNCGKETRSFLEDRKRGICFEKKSWALN